MTRVSLSIGSNLNREYNIRGAITALRAQFGELRLSRVYESEPVGFDGPNFYNLVAIFDTPLGLDALRVCLKDIENNFGRTRDAGALGSRTLDIDLILFGDTVRHDDQYDIPRAEIERYAFVLKPLAEIAGDQLHPESDERFDVMWDDFNDDQALWPIDLDLNN